MNRIADRYFHTIGRIRNGVIFGFLIAGFIVALVPSQVFTTVFLPSTSFGGVVENAAVGVLAGVFSFFGSIGIVPFVAALWFGGAIFAVFYTAMVASTVGIEYLFRALGWLPSRPAHGSVTASGWRLDYTLWPTLASSP